MLRIAASLLLLCLAPAAWTAGPPKDKATWLDMRASELIGKHVANPEGRSLGKVEDLVVGLKGGHIPHVVLSFGGLADLGDKRFVFPVNAFTRDEQRDRIVLNVERSNWPFQPPLARKQVTRQEREGRQGRDRGAGRPQGRRAQAHAAARVTLARKVRVTSSPRCARRGRSAATARRAGCSDRPAGTRIIAQ